jgi:hypothetical protein
MRTPEGTLKGSRDLRSLPVAMVLVLLYYIYYYSKKKAGHTEYTSGQKTPLGWILRTSGCACAEHTSVFSGHVTSGSSPANAVLSVPIYYWLAYIGPLPNLATWFPCGRGRTLFILGSLGQRSINRIFDNGRFHMITLVLYIGSLPNLNTWLPCGRGRTLFILVPLGQRSRSPLL